MNRLLHCFAILLATTVWTFAVHAAQPQSATPSQATQDEEHLRSEVKQVIAAYEEARDALVNIAAESADAMDKIPDPLKQTDAEARKSKAIVDNYSSRMMAALLKFLDKGEALSAAFTFYDAASKTSADEKDQFLRSAFNADKDNRQFVRFGQLNQRMEHVLKPLERRLRPPTPSSAPCKQKGLVGALTRAVLFQVTPLRNPMRYRSYQE